MKEWLIRKGFDSLKRGNVRAFTKMLLVLVLIVYSQLEESILYLIWRIKQVFYKNKILKINGYKMLTLDSDKGISRELAVYGFREKSMTDYLKRTVKKDDICLDIGANLGYYALLESKRAVSGVVYAFEPDKGNFSVLWRNAILNECKNIILCDKAIGDSSGEKDFYLYPKRNWSSFNDRIGYRYFSKIRVEAISLDSFYKRTIKNINLIRMDVEGYESNIIRGGKKMLRESKELTIAIEIHPHLAPKKDIKEMLKILEGSGFEVEAIMLEVPPRLYKFTKIINNFRSEVGVLPYGVLAKKYFNFESLEKILIDENRGFNYYPHVVFKKR